MGLKLVVTNNLLEYPNLQQQEEDEVMSDQVGKGNQGNRSRPGLRPGQETHRQSKDQSYADSQGEEWQRIRPPGQQEQRLSPGSGGIDAPDQKKHDDEQIDHQQDLFKSGEENGEVLADLHKSKMLEKQDHGGAAKQSIKHAHHRHQRGIPEGDRR